MSEKSTLIIDFEKLGGPVYVGRERGLSVREKYQLDKVDQNNEVRIDVLVPEGTFSINPSFFLALFGDSIRRCGNRDQFLAKFRFKAPKHILETIEGNIGRALFEKKMLLDK